MNSKDGGSWEISGYPEPEPISEPKLSDIRIRNRYPNRKFPDIRGFFGSGCPEPPTLIRNGSDEKRSDVFSKIFQVDVEKSVLAWPTSDRHDPPLYNVFK